MRRHFSLHTPELNNLEQTPMRTSVALSIAAALAAVAIGASGEAFARSRNTSPVVRDHRTPAPVVRDHRTPKTVTVRDHRTPKVVPVRAPAKKIIRADRNYDKSPNFKQVIVNGKRVPRRVDGGPVVRDHRTVRPVVRDHRAPVVRRIPR